MAASQTEVCNIALGLLGKATITSITDGSNNAKILQIYYDPVRRMLLQGPGIWRFSVMRASLASQPGSPVSGPYTTVFALPADYIRALQVGDFWPGLDLSDYRLGPIDQDYSIENGLILCDYGAPLSLQYVADLTTPTLWDPHFEIYFACKLCEFSCERLQGSDAKLTAAVSRGKDARRDAVLTGALVSPPQQRADDTWVAARMQ